MIYTFLLLLNIFLVNISLPLISGQRLNSFKLPEYTFGPGDKVKVNIYKMPGFGAEVIVLPDGTINLPRIGNVLIDDLTLNEVNKVLLDKYKAILKNPIIFIDIISFKPVRVSVAGEVNQPGNYALGLSRKNTISSPTKTNSFVTSSEGWPTVVDVLQTAGGITLDADLTNINLKRVNNRDQEVENLNINLWNLLNNGDFSQNYYVFDGDLVTIEKAKAINKKQRNLISKSNLSPSTITINLVGELVKPGLHKVKANTIPIEAILAAGGLTDNANRKDIRLIRLNSNGTLSTKKYSYKDLIESTDRSNLLLDRDVIVVKSTALSKFRKNFMDISDPFFRASTILKILED